MIQNSKSEKEL